MTNKEKSKFLYDFVLDLHNRGLTLNPEKIDYDQVVWEYLNAKSSQSSQKINNDLSPDVSNSVCFIPDNIECRFRNRKGECTSLGDCLKANDCQQCI